MQAESRLSRLCYSTWIIIGYVLVFLPKLEISFLAVRFLLAVVWSASLGLAINIAGLVFAVWARVHLGQYWSGRITLKEGHRLIQSGPYRWVRHPIYTGIITGLIGSAAIVGQVRGLIGVALLAAACIRKIQIEEKLLTRQFGNEYESYKSTTKALIPFLI